MNKKTIFKIKELLKEKEGKDLTLKFLAGDASDRKYYLLKYKNKPSVLMYDQNKKNLYNFKRVTKYLSNKASVPEIKADYNKLGILILEDFGLNKFSEILNSSNMKLIYTSAVDALINIHKNKVSIELERYSERIFFQEIELFFNWYLKFQKVKVEPKYLFRNFKLIFSKFLKRALELPSVFVHRDYHVDNLFFLSSRKKHLKCGWIDYQDALLGPCTYDLVSLTQDARRDVSITLESYLINYYLKTFSDIDTNLFLFSYTIIAIQRHLKVLGIFARLYLRDNKPIYIQHIPRVRKLLLRNLKRSEFLEIHNFLKPYILK